MAYTRRIVTFDKKGRKHVTYRSMGDDASSSDSTDIQIDTPEQTAAFNPPKCPDGAYYDEQKASCITASGAVVPPVQSAGGWLQDLVASGADKVTGFFTGMFGSGSGTTAGSGTAPAAPPAQIAGVDSRIVIAAGIGLGAYYLFGRKKKRS